MTDIGYNLGTEVIFMTERKLRRKLNEALPIVTNRLVLRHIEMRDSMDMYEYASIPDVCEYLLWSPHINLAATEGYIEFLQERYRKGLYGDWALALKETDRMIGTCGYALVDTKSNCCEIGYVLSPKYRGLGYMTEAVEAVLRLSFDVLKFERATLRIIAENEDSVRLAKRIGFSECGCSTMEIKDRTRNILHFEMNRDAYDEKKEAVE